MQEIRSEWRPANVQCTNNLAPQICCSFNNSLYRSCLYASMHCGSLYMHIILLWSELTAILSVIFAWWQTKALISTLFDPCNFIHIYLYDVSVFQCVACYLWSHHINPIDHTHQQQQQQQNDRGNKRTGFHTSFLAKLICKIRNLYRPNECVCAVCCFCVWRRQWGSWMQIRLEGSNIYLRNWDKFLSSNLGISINIIIALLLMHL